MLAHYQLVEVLPNGSHKTLMISSKKSLCVRGLEKYPSLHNVYNGLMLSVFISKATNFEKTFEIHTWFEDEDEDEVLLEKFIEGSK